MRKKRKSKSAKRAAPSPFETFSEPQMELFGLLADGLGMGIAVADTSGMARYANATLLKMLGASGASASLDRPLANYLAPSCQGGFLKAAEASISASMPSQILLKNERNGRSRILIADDHELMRRGVRTLLSGEADLEICGEAVDGLEAISKTHQLCPDLVIMDLTMPRLGGVAAASEIHKRFPSTKILIFTNHTPIQVRGMVRDMGCNGYVSKDRASADLIQAIRTALAGGEFYDSATVEARAAYS